MFLCPCRNRLWRVGTRGDEQGTKRGEERKAPNRYDIDNTVSCIRCCCTDDERQLSSISNPIYIYTLTPGEIPRISHSKSDHSNYPSDKGLANILSLTPLIRPVRSLLHATHLRSTIPLPNGFRPLHTSYTSYRFKMSSGQKNRLAIIGSGNWGSAIAKIAGQNILSATSPTSSSSSSSSSKIPSSNSSQDKSPLAGLDFDKHVPMWVFEEDFEGGKLTERINERHENGK